MTPSENRVLELHDRQRDRNQTTQGYKFQTVAEMSAAPVSKDWLIKGVFARGESSAWIAPPGGMKSALLGHASVCVGYGHDWHGYRSKGATGVVYFALERADLVRRRILAHVAQLGLAPPPIVVVGDMVDPRNAKRITATIHEAEDALGLPIGLAVFDTFAKLVAAAGGNENEAKDQGMVFANLQRVKNLTQVHVAIIGHTGKDVTKGMRGSNAALGDVDLMVEISGDDIRTATVTKANDAPEGPLFSFKSEVHEFGRDEDGDPITVNVVSSETPAAPPAGSRDPRLSKNQQTLFAMLHVEGSAGLTLEDWNAQAREAGIGVKRKADLNDIRAALLSKGLIRNYGDRWHVRHD
jgi:AAA domain